MLLPAFFNRQMSQFAIYKVICHHTQYKNSSDSNYYPRINTQLAPIFQKSIFDKARFNVDVTDYFNLAWLDDLCYDANGPNLMILPAICRLRWNCSCIWRSSNSDRGAPRQLPNHADCPLYLYCSTWRSTVFFCHALKAAFGEKQDCSYSLPDSSCFENVYHPLEVLQSSKHILNRMAAVRLDSEQYYCRHKSGYFMPDCT